MIRVVLLITAIACSTQAIAQSVDLFPGYVVKQGDTLRGYLNIGKNPWNEEFVTLWNNQNREQSQRFGADELTAFGIEPTDEHFIRITAQIERTPMELAPQERLPKIRWVEKKVFVRVLVRGGLNLYSYYDTKWHFLVNSGSSMKELVFVEYKPFGYAKALRYDLYKRQLDSLTADCTTGPSPTLLYRERPILNRVTKYNECKSTQQYARTRGKPYFNATLLIGPSFNNVSYNGISNTQPVTAQFFASSIGFSSTSTQLVGGAFDFSLRKKAKVKLNVEVVNRPAGTFTATNGETDPLKVRRDYFLEIGYTGLNIGFKTRVIRGNAVQVYFQGNISRALSTHLRTYEVLNIQSPNSLTYEPMADFNSAGTGFLAGLQVTYRRFSLLTRWETMSFDASSSSVRQDAFSILAGVSLFR